ncbi:MAG: hypothetical protein ACRCZ0_12085 [Cetobacterium sp.]
MLSEREILLQLINKRELILDIFGKLPLQISNGVSDDKIRFDSFEHNSPAYSMDLNKLYYYNFRENKKGSFIDLISEFSNKPKVEVLNELYLILLSTEGFSTVEDIQDFEYKEYTLEFPTAYDGGSLESYPKSISRMFLRDNIWLSTQLHWGIRYDYRFKRIIIPVYQDGDLVGAIGRLNKCILEPFEQKYMPIDSLVYSKSKVLFGMDEYETKIRDTKMVVLVESEKSVMKAWQYRLPYPVLAVGSSNISRHQIERLNLMGVTKIVWAQDKGIEERSVLIKNMNRLRKYSTAKGLWYLNSDSCDLLKDKECFLDKGFEDIEAIIKGFTKNIKELEVF